MNSERTFTNQARQVIVTWMLAALLALSAVVAHHTLSSLTGIGSAAVAHACQGSAGGGAC